MADGAVAKIRLALEGSPAVVTGLQAVEKQFGSLKSGIAGLAAGLTVGAFAAAIKNQLELADAMAKTAERTGLQLKDVAGLQLAYSMAGVSSDKLETSLGKMAKNMAEGSKAFGAMGVQIKNSDGSLRSTRDVLGDVADKFASYRDGAEKTALAQELFGKSGTEMISVLNGGAEALAESDAQARRLGLTLDEEATAKAVQFNDTLSLLQAGGEGFTRQIAGRLAPTLASLAGELLGTANQSESLDTISGALATTLKGLYSAGVIGAQIFATLGRTVGAVGAAINAVGDAIMSVAHGGSLSKAGAMISDAIAILDGVDTVNAAAWKADIESLGRVWDDTGAKATQAMATTTAAVKRAAPEMAKEVKKIKDEFAELFNELTMKDAGLEKDFFKKLNIMFEGYKKGRTDLEGYRKAVEALTSAQQFAKDAQKQLIEADKARAKQIEDYEKATKDQAKSAADMLDQIKFETRALTMTNAERVKAIALRDLERQGIEAGTDAYEEYAQKILTALDEKAVTEANIEAQNKIREEWQKTTDQMGQSLADSLMQGGKSIAEYLKGLFRNLVLRPIIQPIATGIAGMLMGGSPGTAIAGQGASSAMSLLNIGSTANSLLGGITGNFLGGGSLGAMFANIGAGFTTGLTTLFTDGIGAAFSQATGLMAAGSTGGGLGALAGAGLPLLGGGLLLGNALGLFRSLERKGAGLTGTLGQAGGVHDVDLMRRGGSLFSGPDWFTQDKGVSALDRAIQQQFDLSKGAIKGFAETLGLASDKVDGFTTTLGTQTMGDHGQLGIRLDKDGKPLSDQEVQAAIAEAIKAGSNELAQQLIGTWSESIEQVTRTVVDATGGAGDGWATRQVTEDRTTRSYTPSEFARDGEQAIDTLTRLATSLQGVNSMFDTLGLSVYQTSLAGGDMASQMADAAGGLDKLQASGAAYFQAFYTGSEQHQTALRQLRERFDELGLVMPANRAGLRDMIEGIDRNTEAGRTLTAQLLELAPQLAAVMPQLFQGGQSMSDALTQGLLGTYDGDSLGAYMAQTVSDGIYNAIAGYFAQQITDIVVSGVVDPIIQAAITGASITGAVSQATIDEMVAHANAVAAVATAVLNDPALREALSGIGRAVSSISMPAQRSASSVASYTRAVSESGDAASRAAERVGDAWKSIGDSLMDEVNRIRGVMNESAGQGVDYWQAQLAIARAQALAGDQDAAKSLAGISQNLLRAGEASAGSMLDLQRLRAQVAQELQGVAGYAYGRAGVLPAPPLPEATTGGNMWTGVGVGGMFTAPQFTAPSAPAGASNADVVAELRALRQALEDSNRADTDLQRRTVRVLERMDTLGMPPARVEA